MAPPISRASEQRTPLYGELARELLRIWRSDPPNRTLEQSFFRSRPPSDPRRDTPRTRRMAKAILETRAREMAVPVNQVRVVVPCHGVNVIEALLWLELGAHVVTVEVNSFALRKFKEWMPSPDKFFGRWEAVGPGRQRVEPGDIVAVSHPSGSLNLLPDCLEPQDLLGFGKDDALFVIQSDAAPVFVRPFLEDPEFLARYDTLLHDVEIGVGNYFFPSCHVWFRRFRSELCIVKRDGTPTDGELQKVQGPPGLLLTLARSCFGSRKRPV